MNGNRLRGRMVAVALGVAIGAAIVAVGELVPWPHGLQPLHRQLAAARKQEQSLEQQLSTLRGFERRYRELRAALAAGQRQLDLLAEALPEDPEPDRLLFQLQDAARRSGVTLRRISARPVLPAEDHYELPLEVELDGSYYGLEQFFYLLNLEPRIISVADITLMGLTQPPKYALAAGSTVSGTLLVVAYFRGHGTGQSSGSPATASARLGIR
jgi:Tfp pilus assembly protein PilO